MQRKDKEERPNEMLVVGEASPSVKNRKESLTRQFNSIDNPTVYTRRGLIRGERTLEALKLMHSLAALESSSSAHSPPRQAVQRLKEESFGGSSSAPSSPLLGRRRPPPAFGEGGFYDRSSSQWDWPLGSARVINTKEKFEVTLRFCPFNEKEITAKVMGNELLIHCKSDGVHCINDPRPREIFRSYQMPLNVDPKTVRFEIKDQFYLHVTAKKERPLKLALAYDTGGRA